MNQMNATIYLLMIDLMGKHVPATQFNELIQQPVHQMLMAVAKGQVKVSIEVPDEPNPANKADSDMEAEAKRRADEVKKEAKLRADQAIQRAADAVVADAKAAQDAAVTAAEAAVAEAA